MNKEIEINLTYNNKNKIISLLKPGVEFLRKTSFLDKYYSQGGSKMKQVETFVRIRVIKGEICELTYKGKPTNDHNIKKREELTTKIEDPNVIEKILINSGFKKLSEYESDREYWKINNSELVFINFKKPASLNYLEIEGSSKEKISKIIKKIDKHVKKVGDKIFKKFDEMV